MNTFLRIVATAIATAVAVWLVPGLTLTSDGLGNQILTLLVVAVIFGIVNGVVKPFTTAISACVVILTLGLFLLVINALMLMLTGWLSGQFGLGFHVDGFWPAFFGAIVISVVGAIFSGLLGVEARP